MKTFHRFILFIFHITNFNYRIMNKSPMLILAIAALSVTACNGNTKDKKDTAENTPTEIADIMEESDDEMSTNGIVVGSAYKDFTLKTPEGEEKSLSEMARILNKEGFVTSQGKEFKPSQVSVLIKRYGL